MSHSSAASYTLVNLGPDFKKFIQTSRDLPGEKKWQAWQSFESKYARYYEAVPSADPKSLSIFFERLPTFETQMWSFFDNANQITKSQLQKFVRFFPDLSSPVPVVFMPSILHFNGLGALNIEDHLTLAIGVDHAAYRNNDLGVLFSHELFHNYQFGKLKNKSIHKTMASPLWFEGLAAWVSLQLNPKAPLAQILMNQELANYCLSKEHIIKMASEYKIILRQPQEDQFLADWFQTNGQTLPKRRGYCLGLFTATEIMKNHSIIEVVSLEEKQFSKLLLETLNSVTNNFRPN